MWYAVVSLEQFHREHSSHWRLHPDNAAKLCRVGEMIKVACREQHPVQHPTVDYPGVDILVFRQAPTRNENNQLHAKNTAVVGKGTCAVMAVMHARGELQVGEPLIHESIVGTILSLSEPLLRKP
jgi:proline racemase